MSDSLTKDQFQKVLPKPFKNKISEDLISDINKLISEPELRENFRDNLLGFTNVLLDGKYKLNDYISAVKYVSYRMMGSGIAESYIKTFPDRYQKLISEGADDATVRAFGSAYNKNQLVNKIVEQTLVPTYILNADIYQKAINTQAYLMVNAKSEKVRSDAANSLLSHLKQPETTKLQIDIGMKDDKSIEDLRQATLQLAEQQRKMLESGSITAREIAHSKIINDAEYEEV
jgi:hypothetical protein